MTNANIMPCRAAQYEFEIEIAANTARVWKGLTDQLNAWWLPDFHMLGADSIVSLDLKAGGRMIEEAGDKSLLWYTVLAVDPEKSLSLSGYCTAEWGGPLTTLLTAKLALRGDATVLTVSDALFGHVSDGQIASLQSGWRQLFGEGLKPFVEDGD